MVENPTGSEIIKRWPEESQEAGQLVIDTYGEPQEATESLLTWHQAGPWKRVLASKVYSTMPSRPPISTRWSR